LRTPHDLENVYGTSPPGPPEFEANLRDSITRITSLFPHLRELSLKIAQEEADDSELFYVRLRARRPALSFDDVLALCDETAFDDIPTDDVNSDVEETEPIPVLVDASVQVDIDISASPTFQVRNNY
jgi:hypothetical protein